jgi:hypothetical protein
MKELKQLPLEELDDLFRQATIAAKQAADARGLAKAGLDENDNLVIESPKTDYGRNVA